MRTRSRRFPTFPTASLIAAVSVQGTESQKFALMPSVSDLTYSFW